MPRILLALIGSALASLALSSTLSAQGQTWTPPEHPDPHLILGEAVQDRSAGRYELALAKHLWFHEHALKHQPSLYGVRLSFALAYWFELAEKFPPAMDELRDARDRAATRFHKSGYDRSDFHDFVSLNRTLGEEARTAEAFKALDRMNSRAAHRVYRLAEPSLVRASEYKLCGKYLDPDTQFASAVRLYQHDRRLEAQRAHAEDRPPETARPSFVNRITTLVSLLVQNARREEAQRIADAALRELDDETFRNALAEALTGKVPAPWP